MSGGRFGSWLAVFLVAACGSAASAQVCAGLGSFANAPMQVYGSAAFASGASAFAAGFGFGNRLVFGSANLGTTHIDALNGSSFDLGLQGGFQAPLSHTGDVQLCPVASFGYSSGPNNVGGSGIDLSTVGFETGLALGGSIKAGDRVAVVPAAGLLVAYTDEKASDASGNSASNSTTYGILSLGVGFVINERVAFRPGISVPLGLTGGETSFGLTLAVNFGGGR